MLVCHLRSMKKQASKANTSLQDALAASFQVAAPPVRAEPVAQVTKNVLPAGEESHALILREEKLSLKKTTVSFQADEQLQIDKILDLLLKVRRHRGGFSDAVKIALRLCPLDGEQIGRAWDMARAEDRRTKRHSNA